MNAFIAAGEDFILFIVILVIVGVVRLIKAGMGKAGKIQPPPAKGAAQPSAEQRMRKFLEQVAGVPPTPAAKPRRPRPAREPRAEKPPDKPAEPPASPPPRRVLAPAARPRGETRALYRFDMSLLKGPHSLRHAVVLREILGKPLALRRPSRAASPIQRKSTASG
ncbi:MAG: hypothetical protein ISS72_10960 [Candidatus Brocadiae bacterium]|nr:hypothetical protein [Candidatus Brocadiia bacterium]